MKKIDLKKVKLPNKPGVYFFKKGKNIIYIGKATSLRDRVKSYSSNDLITTRGPLLLDMVVQSDKVEYQTTDSVLEALILEANLIKKYQSKYNTKEKDNKSWNYVCITKGEIPLVLTVRGRILKKEDYSSVYGPFTNGSQLKEAMKIIRRIFPYIDEQSNKKNNREFYKQLGLVPDIITASQKHKNSYRFTSKGEPCTDKNFHIFVSQYKNNIKNLKLFFEGKKKKIVINLKKEMSTFAQKREFEKANEVKKKIFALEHINDVALIKEENILISHVPGYQFRIEAYDIAHLSGKSMVGVMTVIENGLVAKHEYKKFNIRSQSKANDTGALEEVLSRRLRHVEWGLPQLIVMDGGIAQTNVARLVLNRYQFKIPVVSVVKDDKHKAKAIMGDELIINKHKKEILLVNSESHRFAIAFHKQKRSKNFFA
jgi:excinuclease UvrABC nuclease subunit